MRDTDAALKTYLREIGQFPLLTREEEADLARRVQKGDAAARERMISANLRLVVSIAQDYLNRGLPLIDVVAEGNIGLMKAIDRFDPAKGAKLSTYAAWWIKQTIKRALLEQGKTIRLPAHTNEKVSRIRRVSAQLAGELGREATEEELAEELGIAGESLSRLASIGVRPESLDAPLQEDEFTTLGEIVCDEEADDPLELLGEKDSSEQLRTLLNNLNERETTIIAHRFGLDGTSAKPLAQIAEIVGVTRERVRQLEISALAKLRRAFKKQLGVLGPEALLAA